MIECVCPGLVNDSRALYIRRKSGVNVCRDGDGLCQRTQSVSFEEPPYRVRVWSGGGPIHWNIRSVAVSELTGVGRRVALRLGMETQGQES